MCAGIVRIFIFVVRVPRHLDTRAAAAPEDTAAIFQAATTATENLSWNLEPTPDGTTPSCESDHAVDEKENTSEMESNETQGEIQNENNNDSFKGFGSGVDTVRFSTPVQPHPCHELCKNQG